MDGWASCTKGIQCCCHNTIYVHVFSVMIVPKWVFLAKLSNVFNVVTNNRVLIAM